ncbi:uncharacterized protein LOC112051460 [Bicyclus anynana]|uniref:Uncharacterized protein LOC112051460 n=1 Tax=Bicyclus anynana TaxID=110368 RepID=A0ABM3LM70_BICAN|nr:uncharacterized protein LOC112051460 [Bicyclus anynana]XP_052740153.1 uncharacterized protein LOC112051460 [Bicyclus anynana]
MTMTEEEKSSAETVTVVTGNFPTVSSLKSEDSTEQLICKTPQKPVKKKSAKPSVSSKSVEAGSEQGAGTRAVVLLGLAQVALGAALVAAGALAVVKGASLSRVGAGLWAGCVAVVAGVVGVLAGINDCYGINNSSGGGLLTAFLALSLLCLACGNSAAVLAATGLHRDSLRQHADTSSFQDELDAWTPVLTNIALLIIASLHCLVCVASIYHLSKRVCPCFRPKQPFDHNQFDPTFKPVQPCVFHVDEIKKAQDAEKARGHELCKELESKLQGDTLKKKKEESPEFGSANSKEKLVSRWLGRQQAPASTARRGGASAGVRKPRKQPPLMLLPAHPASTLGRMPLSVVVPPAPRYATLPLPPAAYAPPLYYPVPDARVRRRRSPRQSRTERARRTRARRDESQLTRSLERIHRKRRSERDHPTVDDLKRTYTGLDRAYAEQFIAVCDESRHAAEQHDSLASSTDTEQRSH